MLCSKWPPFSISNLRSSKVMSPLLRAVCRLVRGSTTGFGGVRPGTAVESSGVASAEDLSGAEDFTTVVGLSAGAEDWAYAHWSARRQTIAAPANKTIFEKCIPINSLQALLHNG